MNTAVRSYLMLFLLGIFSLAQLGGAPYDRFGKPVDFILSDMTIQEKIGQLFFAFVYGEELSDEAKDTIQASKVGNIIYYAWANGLTRKSQVQNLSKEIQEFLLTTVGVPAIIGVDQEGGRVSRLSGEFTFFPGVAVLAATKDLRRVSESAFLMAQEMHEVGITLDFAPVVDVNSNPNNPVIGARSFSDNPDEVIRFARAMISAFHAGNVGTTLKHFPGHGDTKVDSHVGFPVVYKTKEQLRSCELKPFYALHQETDAIMSAHICVPALDPNHAATFSSAILTDLLRKEIGFKGVVVSDSLVMKGAAPHQHTFQEAAEGVAEASIQAFLAGCDCMLLGRLEWADFPEKLDSITNKRLTEYVLAKFKEAVFSGRISEERVNESVKRILLFKQKLPAKKELSLY